MNYIELECLIENPTSSLREIITAHLAELGFDSFEDTEEGLLAYIPEAQWEPMMLNHEGLWPNGAIINYNWQLIPDQNWNTVWESNFEPVTIGQCHIRAPFHPPAGNFEYELVIEPKMSFGTAHHATTALMVEYLLETDLTGKTMLDMGSGTGILAILALKRGAVSADAVDNDEWAYNNAKENVLNNNTPQVNVILGDATYLAGKKYDVILANINRNILLEDMAVYRASLNVDGVLLMSGFYTEDLPVITHRAEELGLRFISQKTKDNWVSARFEA